MRKITILLAVFAVFGVKSQNVAGVDTVANVSGAKSVVITELDNGVKVQVKGIDGKEDYVYSYKNESAGDTKISVSQDWQLRLPFTKSDTTKVSYKKKKRSKWAIVSGGVYWGNNYAVKDNPELGVKGGSSYELAWDRILGLQYKPFAGGPSLLVGFGVGWKNFKIEDSYNCFVGDKHAIALGKFGDGVVPKYSRLKVFSLRMPFMIRQNLGEGFALSVGSVLNFNTHASIKSCYIQQDEVKVELSFNDVPVRKISYDLMAVLNYNCLGLGVKYTPQTVFEAGKGPQFKSFTICCGLFM